jgi:hypothetical protein
MKAPAAACEQVNGRVGEPAGAREDRILQGRECHAKESPTEAGLNQLSWCGLIMQLMP